MFSIDIEKFVDCFQNRFELYEIEDTARETGFVKRKPRKITPRSFLISVFLSVFVGRNTYQNNAEKIGLLINNTVSKQAVWKRTNKQMVEWLKRILLASIKKTSHLKYLDNVKQNVFSEFNKVLLADSTYISLPAFLAKFFGGSKNQSKKTTATLKIQAVIDIFKEQFCKFDITPYNKNDQKASIDILDIAQPYDLIIRDLGYYTLSVFKELMLKYIFFLSRMKYGVLIYYLDGKTQLNLLAYLKKHSYLEYIDIDVLIGKTEKLPVRLVAHRLPTHVAAERRRKEKNHLDRRRNPSKEYLELLGWEIYITNVPIQIWQPRTVCDVYHIRWRIEIIFKSWKSYFSIANVPQAKKERAETHIYSTLIAITLFHSYIYVNISEKVEQTGNNDISLLKLAKYIKDQSWTIVSFFCEPDGMRTFEIQVTYHCTYEKRKDRKSYPQTLMALS